MLEATASVAMESNMPSGWHLSSSSCMRGQGVSHRSLNRPPDLALGQEMSRRTLQRGPRWLPSPAPESLCHAQRFWPNSAVDLSMAMQSMCC